LFKFFDKDAGGDIDFEEFMQGVKGPMSDRRVKMCKMAYVGGHCTCCLHTEVCAASTIPAH
jgi:hypothetical protein